MTIAWKAALKGLDITYLYAISSTRIRYETEKPFVDKYDLFYKIHLYECTVQIKNAKGVERISNFTWKEANVNLI